MLTTWFHTPPPSCFQTLHIFCQYVELLLQVTWRLQAAGIRIKVIKNTQSVWKKLFEKEGIPLVDGPARNRREDFLTLHPITISGKISVDYLGNYWANILLSREMFNKLKEEDPYEKQSYS